jgi:hypothetical protein
MCRLYVSKLQAVCQQSAGYMSASCRLHVSKLQAICQQAAGYMSARNICIAVSQIIHEDHNQHDRNRQFIHNSASVEPSGRLNGALNSTLIGPEAGYSIIKQQDKSSKWGADNKVFFCYPFLVRKRQRVMKYICIYIHVYMHICIYIYISIYIPFRVRKRQRVM